MPWFEETPDPEFDQLLGMLEINEEDLHGEWKKQATLYLRMARLAARYEAEVQRIEFTLKQKEAQLSKDFRINGIEGISRVTEDAIKAAIQTDSTIQQITEQLIELRRIARLAERVVRAVEIRGFSMKYLQQPGQIPLDDEDRELGRAARRHILRQAING